MCKNVIDSCFSSVANSPTLTLHNFSFRNDPLNAPGNGQEIIRAVDEVVEIFPNKPAPVSASKPQAPASTSLNPSLSGLLKVKMFGKMKEKNQFDAPMGDKDPQPMDSSMDIDDEDFDLEPSQPQTQSLGNSGVTITPISKGKRAKEMGAGSGSPQVNIHMPASVELTKRAKMSPNLAKKKPILRPPVTAPVTCSIHCTNASGYPGLSCVSCHSLYHPTCIGLNCHSDYSVYDFYCSTCHPPSGKENKPAFTLGSSSTTITSALSSGGGPKAKIMPSVTLTPTGSAGGTAAAAKKRSSLGKTLAPLRPIESQSVVNIAGMKYLVVPHPDPAVLKAKKKATAGSNRLVIDFS